MTARITSEQRRHYNQLVGNTGRKALREVDPDRDGLQRLFVRGDEFQAYHIAGIRRYTAMQPDYDLARAILGNDFIPPEKIATARGIEYPAELLSAFAATLPSQELLETWRDEGSFLVAGPPTRMALLPIRDLKPIDFVSPTGGWYAGELETFSRTDMAEPSWFAPRKGPVPGSLNRNLARQQGLLSDSEYVPNAAETTWGLTTYEAVLGIKLAQGTFVRTSSCDSDGDRVYVGWYSDGRFGVNDWWYDEPTPGLGVASAWKF